MTITASVLKTPTRNAQVGRAEIAFDSGPLAGLTLRGFTIHDYMGRGSLTVECAKQFGRSVLVPTGETVSHEQWRAVWSPLVEAILAEFERVKGGQR